MKRSITGRHFELTEPIKSYAESAVDVLDKYNLDITTANTVISNSEKKGFTVEFIVNLKDRNTIVITQNDKDVYAAIDLAIARAQKAMRRMHDRDTSHHKVGLNEAKAQTADVKESAKAMEDEIVPVELELYKPREVEDVLNELKENEKQFEIFIDHEDKTRVLYKRNDGKFGLY